jgi:uncharacterized protein
MRWSPGGGSGNFEDRRGGGGMGMRGGMGIGGTVVLLVLSLIFGRDFVSGGGGEAGPPPAANGDVAPVNETAEEKKLIQFSRFVFDTVQATWSQILPARSDAQFRPAVLVAYRQGTQTGCGIGQAAAGPFYCPSDERVYIDLSFFDELDKRFGAPGDFAQAYVIAHELGHHIQHLLGTDAAVRDIQQRRPSQANAASVALELQADCYAGVWANSAQKANMLETGDVEEGLAAASAVGDDRIQKQTTGRVNSDTFTHGSAAQRASWFRKGLDSGDPKACNTFGS